MSPNDLSRPRRYAELNDEERRRNTHGEPLVFVSSSHSHLFSPLVAAYGPPPSKLELNISVTSGLPAAEAHPLGGARYSGPDPNPLPHPTPGLLFGEAHPVHGSPLPSTIHSPPRFDGLEVNRALQPFANVAISATLRLPPRPAVPSRPKLLPTVTPPRAALGATDAPVVKHGSYVAARRAPSGMGAVAPRPSHDYRRDPTDTWPIEVGLIDRIVAQRLAARVGRDFQQADRLRDELR